MEGEEQEQYLITRELLVLSLKVQKIATANHNGQRDNLDILKWYLMKTCKSEDSRKKMDLIPTLSHLTSLDNSKSAILLSAFLRKLVEEAKLNRDTYVESTEDEKHAKRSNSDDEKEEVEKFFQDHEPAIYNDEMEKVWRIIAGLIENEKLESIQRRQDDWMDNYMHLLCFLQLKESEWKEGGHTDLSPFHRQILELNELEDKSTLVTFVSNLIKSSALIDDETQDAVLLVENKLVKKGFSLSDLSTSTKLLALMGSSFACGVAALPALLSVGKSSSDIAAAIARVSSVTAGASSGIAANAGAFLANSAIFSGVFIGGVCIWNAWRVWKHNRSGKRAAKNIIDSIATTAVGQIVGFGTFALAAGIATTPLGLAVIIACGIGMGIAVSIGTSSIVDRLTRWIFNLPRSEALEEAYNILGVKQDATIDEIHSASRKLCRQFHPDKLKQMGAADEEVEEAIVKFRAVRDAVVFIIQSRAEEHEETERPDFLDKMFSFFKGFQWKFGSDADEKEKQGPLPLTGKLPHETMIYSELLQVKEEEFESVK